MGVVSHCVLASGTLLMLREFWKGGWFCPSTVSTLSTLSRASKNGMSSRSSVSLGSSNQDVTGTFKTRRGEKKKKKKKKKHQ